MTATASVSMTDASTVDMHHVLQILNARITYKNAAIHLLEKFTFKELDLAHEKFLKAGFEECVILQTCNRVEVFATAIKHDEKRLLDIWASIVGLSSTDFETVEIGKGKNALVHLMKLASGLDSLVVGEDQILGQVRRAFEFAKCNQYAGPRLSVIFDRALKVGSRVRAQTGINRGNVSIASVAVALAEEYFDDDLCGKQIMLVGTGEAASLLAKVLKRRQVNFLVTSRLPERARSFAEKVAGNPVPFDSALEMLPEIDIVFTATKAPYRLITYERIENAMRHRKNGGIMIFDLSNPRTVDERVATLHGVKLMNMDQIAELVGRNMRSRMKKVMSAEKLIESEIKSVDTMINRMKAEPVVVSVFKTVDAIRQRELKKALSLIGRKMSPEEARVVEHLSYAIIEGVLSAPMNNLRKEIESGTGDELVKIVSKLFTYEAKSAKPDR